MNCLTIRPLLAAYLDHELNASERGEVERHLAMCAECQAELNALVATQRYTRTTFQEMATASVSPAYAWQRLQTRLSQEQRRPFEALLIWWEGQIRFYPVQTAATALIVLAFAMIATFYGLNGGNSLGMGVKQAETSPSIVRSEKTPTPTRTVTLTPQATGTPLPSGTPPPTRTAASTPTLRAETNVPLEPTPNRIIRTTSTPLFTPTRVVVTPTEAPLPTQALPSTGTPTVTVTVTPTFTATAEPVPATEIPIPATEEPVPATEIPIPATEEPIPATEIPIPATEEPVPATEIPIPATPTREGFQG